MRTESTLISNRSQAWRSKNSGDSKTPTRDWAPKPAPIPDAARIPVTAHRRCNRQWRCPRRCHRERARSFPVFQLGGAAAAIRSLLKSTRSQHLDQPKAQSAAGVSARRPPLKTAFGGTNHPTAHANRVYAHCEPISGVAEQKFRRFENTHQRLAPKTGLKTASTRPPKGAETLSGSASL